MRLPKLMSLVVVLGATLSIASELTVVNGFGSGTYQPGDTIDVFADPNPTNQVFDTWTSSPAGVTAIPSLKEYHFRLIMPAQNVTLTPSYQTYTPWSFTHTNIIGKELYYYLPAAMKGIIFCFHGHGGSATGWVDPMKGVEDLNFCTYAVAHGYGLFITESNDRQNKAWDVTVSNTNSDIVSIYQMLDTLKKRGVVTGNEKMFSNGFSQGAGFSSVISYVKNFSAAAIGGVAGNDKVYTTSTIPTFWYHGLNDTSADPNRGQTIIDAYTKLHNRGIDAEYFFLHPTPVFPKRFERIPGIDSAEAVGIFNDLKNAGYLDSRNYLNINVRVQSGYINSVTSVPNSFDKGIDDQMTVAFTEHKFYSDVNNKTITFFDKYTGTTNVGRNIRSAHSLSAARSVSSHASELFDLRGARVSSLVTFGGNRAAGIYVVKSRSNTQIESRRMMIGR